MREAEIEAAEAARAQAEIEREEREIRRRIAEGGPDNHITPGTTGRVEAEEARQQSFRTWMARYATLIALTVAFVCLIPTAISLVLLYRNDERLDREIAARCQDAAVNRQAIRQTVIDGLPALGYAFKDGKVVPDGPPLDYYRTHEDERQAALVRTTDSLKRFAVVDCGNP